MYNNLNLYYLKHIGITPWISRKSPDDATKKNIPLLIITSKLGSKEQQLLTNIILFLGLQNDQLIHLEEDRAQEQKITPTCTLLFGLNLECKSTIMNVASLHYFLNNPSAKKELFQHLLLLKEQLAVL